MHPGDRQRDHWRRNRLLTAMLLLMWFLVTFGAAFFARSLSFTILGWPFSFYMAAQGCLLIYLLLILAYAKSLRSLDEEHGVDEAEDP